MDLATKKTLYPIASFLLFITYKKNHNGKSPIPDSSGTCYYMGNRFSGLPCNRPDSHPPGHCHHIRITTGNTRGQ